jgi:hypothetical protein
MGDAHQLRKRRIDRGNDPINMLLWGAARWLWP